MVIEDSSPPPLTLPQVRMKEVYIKRRISQDLSPTEHIRGETKKSGRYAISKRTGWMNGCFREGRVRVTYACGCDFSQLSNGNGDGGHLRRC